MPYYIINKNSDEKGLHEVHTTDCTRKPLSYNSESLGYFTNGVQAVAYAKSIGWKTADGCKYCCPEAHHG